MVESGKKKNVLSAEDEQKVLLHGMGGYRVRMERLIHNTYIGFDLLPLDFY